MVDKKLLKAISALKPSAGGTPEWMINDVVLDVYVKKLADFVDSLPGHEDAIKAALDADDNKTVSEHLTAIWDMLVQIHAEKMAADCLKKIGELKDMGKMHLEAYIEKFFNDVSSLSIDIQIAIYSENSEDLAATKRPAVRDQIIRILAVDDSAFFLNNLKTCLKDTPYKLTCVTSGSDALRFLEKKIVDLIILDIEMPGMDGYQTANEIRKRGEQAPIVFLTGNAKKEYVVKAIQFGAVDFIVKPINKEHVLEKITKYA